MYSHSGPFEGVTYDNPFDNKAHPQSQAMAYTLAYDPRYPMGVPISYTVNGKPNAVTYGAPVYQDVRQNFPSVSNNNIPSAPSMDNHLKRTSSEMISETSPSLEKSEKIKQRDKTHVTETSKSRKAMEDSKHTKKKEIASNKFSDDKNSVKSNESEDEDEDQLRDKRSKRLKRDNDEISLVSKVVPEIQFPLDGLHEADVERIKKFDMDFCCVEGLDHIVQKGLKTRPKDFVLSYYWVWNGDSRLNLDSLYNLRAKYDWIEKMEVNVSGNSCDKQLFAKLGLKSLCFCDNCRPDSTDEVYRSLSLPPSSKTQRGNVNYVNNHNYNHNKNPESNKSVTTNYPISTSNKSENILNTGPYMMSVSPSGFGTNGTHSFSMQPPGSNFLVPQLAAIPRVDLNYCNGHSEFQYQHHLPHTYINNGLAGHNSTYGSLGLHNNTTSFDFKPTEEEISSTHSPRFWVVIKKTTEKEKNIYSRTHN